MTSEEALNLFKEIYALKSKIVYTDIDAAIEKAIEALEKQVPKKPVLKKHENRIISERMVEYCPNCDEVIEGYDKFDNNCPWCGQKLDWSDYE